MYVLKRNEKVFFSHYRERSMEHLKNAKGGFTGLLVVIRSGIDYRRSRTRGPSVG